MFFCNEKVSVRYGGTLERSRFVCEGSRSRLDVAERLVGLVLRVPDAILVTVNTFGG